MNLSPHFSLSEALFSSTAQRLGIDNSKTTPQILSNAIETAKMMEKIRTLFGNIPLHIDSWIRCLELNRAIRSKDTSQHLTGEAVDFICPAFGTPIEIAATLVQHVNLVDFDQLIYEHTWIHISRKAAFETTQRRNVLTLMPDGSYSTGIK